MSITTVGAHLIHYEALGRGDPLIFLHGWLGSWRYWWPSMQGLSRYFRTFAFDFWGFGDSSKPAGEYRFEAYVEMVDAFIEQLGMARPVTLVGHGLGAAVALRYAYLQESKVNRLVAVSLPVRGSDINNRLLTADAASFFNRITGRADNYPEIQQELRKTDSAAIHRVTQQLTQIDFTREMDNLACPLLMISGDQDAVVARPSGEMAHYLEPAGGRAFVTFEACAHFPMLDEQAKFSRLVLEFTHTDKDNLSALSPKDYWQRRTH